MYTLQEGDTMLKVAEGDKEWEGVTKPKVFIEKEVQDESFESDGVRTGPPPWH